MLPHPSTIDADGRRGRDRLRRRRCSCSMDGRSPSRSGRRCRSRTARTASTRRRTAPTPWTFRCVRTAARSSTWSRCARASHMVYSWRAVEIARPERLTSEFHGHTDRAPGTTGTLIFYRKATGGTENGSLVAPFDGIHGWYLKNDTDRPGRRAADAGRVLRGHPEPAAELTLLLNSAGCRGAPSARRAP